MSSVDSGYAWVIPFSCFMIQGTLFGTYRSYGLLYKVLLDTFRISRSDASWPFSLCMTVIHLTGPVSGSLNKYFSVRTISFVGCFLAAAGVGLCFLADHQNVAIIIGGIGIVQGFGIGLTYVQSNAIINQYFVKYRATAIGISLSGGTIGAFFMSCILESSLKHYPLQDCFLILSGVILLTLPFCFLLKPFKTKDQVLEDNLPIVASCRRASHALARVRKNSQSAIIPSLISTNQFYAANIQNSILSEAAGANLTYGKQKDETECEADSRSVVTPIHCHLGRNQCQQGNARHSLPILALAPATPAPKSTLSSSLTSSSTTLDSLSSSDSILKCISTMLSDCMFLLIAATHMAYFWASITYCMIVVDFALDKGISVKDGVDLITAFSVGDLIGRLGSGIALDYEFMPLKTVAMISSIGIGVLMNSTILMQGYWAFVLISAGLGFLSGVINVLLNQLFCQYMGSENAALAFGLSAFLSGIATTVRPLVVGTFRDANGSYDGLLISLGLVSLATGFLWFLEPVLERRRHRREAA